jgi:hypothetical protein
MKSGCFRELVWDVKKCVRARARFQGELFELAINACSPQPKEWIRHAYVEVSTNSMSSQTNLQTLRKPSHKTIETALPRPRSFGRAQVVGFTFLINQKVGYSNTFVLDVGSLYSQVDVYSEML